MSVETMLTVNTSTCFVLVLCAKFCVAVNPTQITINVKGSSKSFDHFWESTGLCPPDPKNEVHKFLLSDQEKLNFALIGALPNQGIKQVRIHWLLNLIFTRNGVFNFTHLDDLLDFLVDHELKPRFELMGYPVDEASPLEKRKLGRSGWRNLVSATVNRYVARFGAAEVSSWKFELWNEPDLKNYNLLNFTLSEYLAYVDGCAEGLSSLRGAVLGGPAGLFREDHHPLCWGLLQSCSGNFRCPIHFISFHRKGGGAARGVLNGTLELLDSLHNKFPDLAHIPIANDESDIVTTWSDSWEWRGDARYAAMVVKVIADHYKSIVLDRKLKIELLSFDNAFLNYHPFYFTQRTLFARFQINHTEHPHDQFIKKPVYAVMGLLSLLGDRYLPFETDHPDPLLTVLATRTSQNSNPSNIAVLAATCNNSEVNAGSIKSVKLHITNLSTDSRFVVYLLDNIETNPYGLWKAMGSPVFPDRFIRDQLRRREGPYRLISPTDLSSETLNVTLNLTTPSIALLHICPKPSSSPGAVAKLSVFNVTANEVLLTWSDSEVYTKCIRTYEVEFESKCGGGFEFRRINARDSMFLSFHYATEGDGACEGTTGRYRVRAVDYWDQRGNYSEIVSYP